MGLAVALSPGVRRHSQYRSNWCFKTDTDLKAMYNKIMEALTNGPFGEYITIEYFFGVKIAQRLALEKQIGTTVF
jgi:hypothetical protein